MDWFSWLSKAGLDPPLIYEYGLAFARNELQYEDIAYFNHEFLQSMGIAVAKHRLEILKLAKKENGANPRSISRLFVAISKTKKSFSKYFSRLVFQDDMSSPKDLPEAGPGRYQEHWKGALLRKQRSDETRDDRPGLGLKNRALALSGPIDLRVHERLMANTTKSLKLSGPLDGKLHERLMYPNRSPRLTTGPINGRILAPERLMITTTRSPRLSGPLDGRGQDRLLVNCKSPKISGPLDSRVLSPKFCSPYEKEKEEVEYDEHSLWTALFHDMKPT
ncbi:Mitogen-activated protein kinase kinase kinase [Trema orientale]|uniref:Mitogen-activated protein kinase kinase kinase n=1 Tax=Trema orientale TaxID=63057 RepID=A0A2P5BU73_TREOI|nr:Mitogen-activated protein kinase kinase kinase [Trema orientale]